MQQTDYTQRRRLAAQRRGMILIPVTGEVINSKEKCLHRATGKLSL